MTGWLSDLAGIHELDRVERRFAEASRIYGHEIAAPPMDLGCFPRLPRSIRSPNASQEGT